MGLLDGILGAFGIDDSNRARIGAGITGFAQAIGKPTGGAAGTAFANGILGYSAGKRAYDDEQYDKLEKQAKISELQQKAEDLKNNNYAARRLFNPNRNNTIFDSTNNNYYQGITGSSAPSSNQPLTPPPALIGSPPPVTVPPSLRSDNYSAQPTTASNYNSMPSNNYGMPNLDQEALQYFTIKKPEVINAIKNLRDLRSPQHVESGWLRNYDGNMSYLPKMADNMTIGQNGSAIPVPGALSAISQLEGAKAGAVAGAQYPYEIGKQNNQAQNQRTNTAFDKGMMFDQLTKQFVAIPRMSEIQAQNQGAITSATERAKAENELVKGFDESGRSIYVPKSSLLPSNNLPNNNIPNQIMPNQATNQLSAQPPAQPAGKVYADAPPNVTQKREINTDFTKNLLSDFVKNEYSKANEDANLAQSNISNINALKAVNFKTSPGSSVALGLGKTLSSFGIHPDVVNDYVAKGAVFNKLTGDRVFNVLAEQKGTQTEGDAQRAANLYAKIDNPQDANRMIMAYTEALSNRALAKQQFYAKHINDGDDQHKLPQLWNSILSKSSILDDKAFDSVRDVIQKWSKQ